MEPTALNEFTQATDARLELIPAPTGPGRIVQLSGYHYHNPTDVNDPARGAEYLRRTILYNLKHGSIELPISLERQRAGETGTEEVKLSDMGIYYPVHVDPGSIDDQFQLLDPKAAAEARKKLLESQVKNRREARTGAGGVGGGMGGSGGMGGMSSGMTGGMGSGMSSGMGGAMNSMNNQIAAQLSQDKILKLSRYDFVIQFVWMETPPSTRDERKRAAEEAAKAAESGDAAGAETSADEDENASSDAATDTTTAVEDADEDTTATDTTATDTTATDTTATDE